MPALVAIVLALTLPQHGVLVPGRSLGGVRLGMTQSQVESRWGTFHGRCRDCPDPTWYFTYAKFTQQGAAVAFRRGRAVAVFTIWSPAGWSTTKGLRVGDAQARATSLYGALLTVHCGSYDALVANDRGVQTAIYVYGGKVWGFGLSAAAAPVCH